MKQAACLGVFTCMLFLYQRTTAEESSDYRRIHVRPGRHVCLSETVLSRPIPVSETYKKAVYTPRRRNCSRLTSCPQYDVTYVTATKTAYHHQKSGSFKYDCCPGWTTQEHREKGCMQPVCNSGCGELGRCVQPGICECPRGFQGQNCDTDIDECLSNNHGCHQFCVNTAGSYLCACQDGFSLAEDGKTCIYCYTCSKEYIVMQEELRQLRQELKESQMTCSAAQLRTESLEYKFNRIKAPNVQYNLAQLEIKVDELITSVEHFRNIPSSTTSTTPTVSLKTSQESIKINASSATSSATENVTVVSQISTSTPKDLMSPSNPKLSQNASNSSMLLATKVLVAGLTSEFPAKDESSESERFSERTRIPSEVMDDVRLAKTTPTESPYKPVINVSTKLPSEASTVKTVSSADELILPVVFKDLSTGTSPTPTASTFSSRDVSYQGTKQPASPKTASSSSVPTASALPSKDVSSSAMRIPATTITTSSSSAPKQGPQYLPLFLYDRFASLSEQIGILEERIGWCACREPPPY